jgi:uncharacterized protein
VKLLLWLALAALVIWMLRAPRRHPGRMPAPEPEKSISAGEPMERCVYCGLHIPASEAVFDAGSAFCSEEHHRLHQSSR